MQTKKLSNVPQPTVLLTATSVATGPYIAPIDRVKCMSASDWETFILEWAHSLKSDYADVEKHAGAGDMGLDVVAYVSKSPEVWDNYQCKHYHQKLSPSDIWLELGKLCYYTFRGDYNPPRKYFFVSPEGPTVGLSKLLRKPEQLRKDLIAKWDTTCRKQITSKQEIKLEGKLLLHINSFDFSNISNASILQIIEQHARTPHHVARFGGGLKPRPTPPPPPAAITDEEATYIRALLDAYEERLKISLQSHANLTDQSLAEHLSRSRREFYCAEALKAFSRENVPTGTFEQLMTDVYDGIIDVVNGNHTDAYERILAVVKQAKALNISSHALASCIRSADLGGICHQLANEKRVKWRK